MKNHRLRTLLSEAELIHAMTGLRRQTKISMEENGVNTVYLALGFLQWYETERSESRVTRLWFFFPLIFRGGFRTRVFR